jgi:methylmalonyl-CoA mutase
VVGSAFSDLGFDVVLGPLFQTPEEAARQAALEHVDIVGSSRTLRVPEPPGLRPVIA